MEKNLYFWYRKDFAWATTARKKDQSVEIKRFQYKVARTSNLKLYHM